MDIEAGKSLTNEEVIRELLELLKKNAMKEQAMYLRMMYWRKGMQLCGWTGEKD